MNRTNTELDSLTRDVSRRFIEAHYPEEVPYFSLIWQQLAESYAAAFRNQPVAQQKIDITTLGLPFDGEETVKLITPSIILMIEGSVQRLRGAKSTPTLGEIQAVLRDSAQKAGATKALADGLAKFVAPALLVRLQESALVSAKNARRDLYRGVSEGNISIQPLSISADYMNVVWWGFPFACSEWQGRVVKAFDNLRLENNGKTSPITDWKKINPGGTGYSSIRKVFHNDRQNTDHPLFNTLIVQHSHGKFYLDVKSPQDAKLAHLKSINH